jgi:hypothetical protein
VHPSSAVTGAFLIIAAVLTLWYEIRGRHHHDDDGHGHAQEPDVGWLLRRRSSHQH